MIYKWVPIVFINWFFFFENIDWIKAIGRLIKILIETSNFIQAHLFRKKIVGFAPENDKIVNFLQQKQQIFN